MTIHAVGLFDCSDCGTWRGLSNLAGSVPKFVQSADGAAPSIPDAAAQFGNEIEAERKSGGYASVNALRKALYYHTKELGIAQFAKRINTKTQ